MFIGIYYMYVYKQINYLEIDLIFCRSRYSFVWEGRSYGLYSGSGVSYWGIL